MKHQRWQPACKAFHVNAPPCVFEQALLGRSAACEAAQRLSLDGREQVICHAPLGRAACGQLLTLLRANSSFALKLKEPQRTMPRALMMKLQCGGLAGLRDLLDADAPAPDVLKLMRKAQADCGAIENLPFSRIMQGVAGWQHRQRRQVLP